MLVAVTGASGLIGTALVRRLQAELATQRLQGGLHPILGFLQAGHDRLRRVAEDVADVEQVEGDPRLVGDGGQVQQEVLGSTLAEEYGIDVAFADAVAQMARAFGLSGIIWGTIIAYTLCTAIPIGLYIPRLVRQLIAPSEYQRSKGRMVRQSAPQRCPASVSSPASVHSWLNSGSLGTVAEAVRPRLGSA